MRLKAIVVSGLMLTGWFPAFAEAPAGDDTTKFSVTDRTQVPGATLPAGNYTISMVDRLSDRTVVHVDSTSGNVHAVFLALPNAGLPKAGSGPIRWNSAAEGGVALRGFSFPGGRTVEFVYPKAEAVALAKANNNAVAAIDPESEGRVPAANLSKEDMQMVTLWMLSPTAVQPGESGPGIKATRYMAANHPPPRIHPKVAMAALPHTAGLMPLIWAVGLLSFAGASTLGVRRRMTAPVRAASFPR